MYMCVPIKKYILLVGGGLRWINAPRGSSYRNSRHYHQEDFTSLLDFFFSNPKLVQPYHKVLDKYIDRMDEQIDREL